LKVITATCGSLLVPFVLKDNKIIAHGVQAKKKKRHEAVVVYFNVLSLEGPKKISKTVRIAHGFRSK
jgi:hypothetical protein